MSDASQIYDRVRVGQKIDAFTVNSCMKFFIGWMKRFGYTKETFYVPLEQKSKSKPLRPRTLNILRINEKWQQHLCS